MFHHYIITRFSILDTKTKAFRLTQKRSSNIKHALFDKVRLNTKFTLFDKLTYPSIRNQSYKSYTWLIYASPYLPNNYKQKLEKYQNSHIKVIYVKNFKEMNENIEGQIKHDDFSTIRLDDDDGLNPDFLEMLNKYKSEKGAIVSAPHGRWIRIQNGEFKIRGRINSKHMAQGLAGIGFNIYTAGNHTRVHEKHRVIYDDLPEAFFRSCSQTSDTKSLC